MSTPDANALFFHIGPFRFTPLTITYSREVSCHLFHFLVQEFSAFTFERWPVPVLTCISPRIGDNSKSFYLPFALKFLIRLVMELGRLSGRNFLLHLLRSAALQSIEEL